MYKGDMTPEVARDVFHVPEPDCDKFRWDGPIITVESIEEGIKYHVPAYTLKQPLVPHEIHCVSCEQMYSVYLPHNQVMMFNKGYSVDVSFQGQEEHILEFLRSHVCADCLDKKLKRPR